MQAAPQPVLAQEFDCRVGPTRVAALSRYTKVSGSSCAYACSARRRGRGPTTSSGGALAPSTCRRTWRTQRDAHPVSSTMLRSREPASASLGTPKCHECPRARGSTARSASLPLCMSGLLACPFLDTQHVHSYKLRSQQTCEALFQCLTASSVACQSCVAWCTQGGLGLMLMPSIPGRLTASRRGSPAWWSACMWLIHTAPRFDTTRSAPAAPNRRTSCPYEPSPAAGVTNRSARRRCRVNSAWHYAYAASSPLEAAAAAAAQQLTLCKTFSKATTRALAAAGSQGAAGVPS